MKAIVTAVIAMAIAISCEYQYDQKPNELTTRLGLWQKITGKPLVIWRKPVTGHITIIDNMPVVSGTWEMKLPTEAPKDAKAGQCLTYSGAWVDCGVVSLPARQTLTLPATSSSNVLTLQGTTSGTTSIVMPCGHGVVYGGSTVCSVSGSGTVMSTTDGSIAYYGR